MSELSDSLASGFGFLSEKIGDQWTINGTAVFVTPGATRNAASNAKREFQVKQSTNNSWILRGLQTAFLGSIPKAGQLAVSPEGRSHRIETVVAAPGDPFIEITIAKGYQ